MGDVVGWADTWVDDEGCDMAGLVVWTESIEFDETSSEKFFDILLASGLVLTGIEKEELVIMFEKSSYLEIVHEGR